MASGGPGVTDNEHYGYDGDDDNADDDDADDDDADDDDGDDAGGQGVAWAYCDSSCPVQGELLLLQK